MYGFIAQIIDDTPITCVPALWACEWIWIVSVKRFSSENKMRQGPGNDKEVKCITSLTSHQKYMCSHTTHLASFSPAHFWLRSHVHQQQQQQSVLFPDQESHISVYFIYATQADGCWDVVGGIVFTKHFLRAHWLSSFCVQTCHLRAETETIWFQPPKSIQILSCLFYLTDLSSFY